MKNDIKDVDYEDINDDKTKKIRGKILYYMPSQVATILNQQFPNLKEPISESKVRFYTKTFGNLLGEEASNKPARFIEQDIEKFKFIVELKESGMTLKQIQEYCEDVSFDENTGIQIKESNPLSIKSLATALLEEQNNQLQKFKEELLSEIDSRTELLDNKLKQYLVLQAEENMKVAEKLKEDIVLTVDEVVSEKLTENSKEIKSHIDQSTEKTNQLQQDNKKILEELAVSIAEIKERDKKIAELLDDPEAFEKTKKKIKNEEDRFFSKIAKKVFGK